MKRKLLAIAMASLALLPGMARAQQTGAVDPRIVGTWINPPGTVKVTTGGCGDKLCGWVVWAAPQAQADAREGGVTQLIGTELLRDYQAVGPGRYQGTVYVPDMGKSFYSIIEQQDENSLRISGCILAGLMCKSQNWRRA